MSDTKAASSTSGHTSLRYVKKLCFSYLQMEAPALLSTLENGTLFPVLDVVLELQVPTTMHANQMSVSPRPSNDDVRRPMWDVPPRYLRLRQQKEAEEKLRVAAIKGLWGNGSNSMLSAASYAQSCCDPAIGADSRQFTGFASVSQFDLERCPPTITAYRTIALTDAPPHIQNRAVLDPHWVESAGGATNLIPHVFLCWCSLFTDKGSVMLFSDAMMMRRTPSSISPSAGSSVGQHSPLRYYKERADRLSQSSDPSHRMLALVAQQHLYLGLELRDKELSESLYPDAAREDRFGLPRGSQFRPQTNAGEKTSQRGVHQTHSDTLRNSDVRHSSDVANIAERWVQSAQHHIAPRNEQRISSDLFSHPNKPDDEDETFCVPSRRVGLNELGRGAHPFVNNGSLGSASPSSALRQTSRDQSALDLIGRQHTHDVEFQFLSNAQYMMNAAHSGTLQMSAQQKTHANSWSGKDTSVEKKRKFRKASVQSDVDVSRDDSVLWAVKHYDVGDPSRRQQFLFGAESTPYAELPLTSGRESSLTHRPQELTLVLSPTPPQQLSVSNILPSQPQPYTSTEQSRSVSQRHESSNESQMSFKDAKKLIVSTIAQLAPVPATVEKLRHDVSEQSAKLSHLMRDSDLYSTRMIESGTVLLAATAKINALKQRLEIQHDGMR